MPSAAPISACPLHFAAFVMNTTGHIIQGTWRRPSARQTDFNDLEHWVGLARTLERGRFDAIFFADVVGLYAPYRGDERKYFEAGLQVPSNDPSVLASALEFTEGTLRHKLFGAGDRLPERHPATRYRGAFAPQTV